MRRLSRRVGFVGACILPPFASCAQAVGGDSAASPTLAGPASWEACAVSVAAIPSGDSPFFPYAEDLETTDSPGEDTAGTGTGVQVTESTVRREWEPDGARKPQTWVGSLDDGGNPTGRWSHERPGFGAFVTFDAGQTTGPARVTLGEGPSASTLEGKLLNGQPDGRWDFRRSAGEVEVVAYFERGEARGKWTYTCGGQLVVEVNQRGPSFVDFEFGPDCELTMLRGGGGPTQGNWPLELSPDGAATTFCQANSSGVSYCSGFAERRLTWDGFRTVHGLPVGWSRSFDESGGLDEAVCESAKYRRADASSGAQ